MNSRRWFFLTCKATEVAELFFVHIDINVNNDRNLLAQNNKFWDYFTSLPKNNGTIYALQICHSNNKEKEIVDTICISA